MTEPELRQLVARRRVAYGKQAAEYALRGAVLDAAEAAGTRPEDSLSPDAARRYDAHTAEIDRLNDEIAGLDQAIANAGGPR